jgi:hypothetical protein
VEPHAWRNQSTRFCVERSLTSVDVVFHHIGEQSCSASRAGRSCKLAGWCSLVRVSGVASQLIHCGNW